MTDHEKAADVQPPLFPHIPIAGMNAGTPVNGAYILKSAAIKTTAAGKPFLSAELADQSGSVAAILWNYSGPISAADEGKIAVLRGQVSDFKGALQISLEQIRLKEPGESVDLASLVPVAPIDEAQMYAEIQALVASVHDSDYRAICEAFLQRHAEQFCSIPAAKSVHHSFVHGLLMHTGYMVKIADHLAALYCQVVNRDLLLTGTLLHDFAKREEFTFSELGLVAGYSTKGQLLGHLVMGAQEVCEIAQELHVPEEKSVLLQHMLLSHHGKPEYGAAVIPMCAESELLSMIDMMDSRMEIYRENLEQTPLGEFSGRIFALDGHRIYHHYDPET